MTQRTAMAPESVTAFVLNVGTAISVGLLTVGIVLSPLDFGHGAGVPHMVLRIGLWTTMLVPLFGVLASLVSFARKRETAFALIASGVLLILALSVFLGLYLPR